jgi:hypothetical protein
MWDEGIVSVDANILLHIYRYSQPLLERLFAILEKLGPRLWVSHRAAYEFSKNRLSVISSQEKAYDKACAVLDKALSTINSELPPRHPTIQIEAIKESFAKLVKEQKAALQKQKEGHPKVPPDDPVCTRLTSLLTGKIGPRYSAERESEIPKEGEKRNQAKIPPGFRDASKDDEPLHRFGDFIVWRQLLDQVARAKATSFIFVTDDTKDDWWWKQEGQTIGPHPGLIEEAKSETGARAYLYRGDQFIRYGAEHFGLKPDEKLIDEAAKVRSALSWSGQPVSSKALGFRIRRIIGDVLELADPSLKMAMATMAADAVGKPELWHEVNARLMKEHLPDMDTMIRIALARPDRRSSLLQEWARRPKQGSSASRTSTPITQPSDTAPTS